MCSLVGFLSWHFRIAGFYLCKCVVWLGIISGVLYCYVLFVLFALVDVCFVIYVGFQWFLWYLLCCGLVGSYVSLAFVLLHLFIGVFGRWC